METALQIEARLEKELVLPSSQRRSREKTERLVEAGFRLIALHGFDGLKIADLTAEAGVTVATFYQRFKDKEAFLAVLQLRSNRRLRENLAAEKFFERVGSAPLDEVGEMVVARFVKGYEIGEPLIRELLRRSPADPAIHAPLKSLGIWLREALVEALRPRFAEFDHPDPALAVGLVVECFFGLLGNILLYAGAPVGLRDPRLKIEMVEMFDRYLGIPKAPGAKRKR